jgi:hypothetical protein
MTAFSYVSLPPIELHESNFLRVVDGREAEPTIVAQRAVLCKKSCPLRLLCEQESARAMVAASTTRDIDDIVASRQCAS